MAGARSGLVAAALLLLAGCSAPPGADTGPSSTLVEAGTYWVLHVHGAIDDLSPATTTSGGPMVVCDPMAPSAAADPATGTLTVPDDIGNATLQEMKALTWVRIDAPRGHGDCPSSTLFQARGASFTLQFQLPQSNLASWDLLVYDAGIMVNGFVQSAGYSKTTPYDYVGDDGHHYAGNVTWEILGPWQKQDIRTAARPQGFGHSDATHGYWVTA